MEGISLVITRGWLFIYSASFGLTLCLVLGLRTVFSGTKLTIEDVLGGLMVDSAPPMQGAQVQSLVREVRSQVLQLRPGGAK